MTNIPDTYRAPSGGTKRLVFEGVSGYGYLDAPDSQSLYGIIEGVFVDDNIFPQRTGSITSVNMDFFTNAIARVDKLIKNSTPSDCLVQCNGYGEVMYWDINESFTMYQFYIAHKFDFGAVHMSQLSDIITFTADIPGVDFAEPNTFSGGSLETIVSNVSGYAGTDLNPETSYIEDTSINFDINAYKIAGQTPSIIFKSGELSGVQCEISKFDYANKRMYLKAFTDSDGYTQPNPTHSAASGDTYTLVNMSMPQTYIDTAETDLQTATQRYLDENCAPHAIYTLDIDPKDAKLNNISLKAGDRVTIIDTALSIDKLIRISSIEYPLVDPYRIKVVLANPVVPYTLQERLVKAASIITKGALFSTSSPIKGMVPGANNAGASYFLNAKGAWVVPAITAVSSSSSVIKDIIHFTATAIPMIANYQTTYAAAHGETPTVALRTIDEDGNIIDRAEQPKFTMSSGLISSISWDLPDTETGFIILN
jgi:hypothetical protein